MILNRCETINPHVKTKTFFYTELVSMEKLQFHKKPDQSLRGTRYMKRQMIPDEVEEEASSDEITFPPDSFLWKSNLSNPDELEAHFDSKKFMQNHVHLLPPNDHSLELEKSLKNRRRRMGTMSTVDSKLDRGFTSTDDVNFQAELQSPYDELTYEETLFEVHDDRIQAKSATSNDEADSTLNSNNRSMISTMNRRKRQKINDSINPIGQSKSIAETAEGNHTEEKMVQRRHHSPSRRHHSGHHGEHGTSRDKYQSEGSDKDLYQTDVIPTDLLEQYIEERIKAVEMQIRNEYLGSNSNQRDSVPNTTISLLDKVPEAFSLELEQADESSRDSLLKEIAAVLVSKGYVANVESRNNKTSSKGSKQDTLTTYRNNHSNFGEKMGGKIPKHRRKPRIVSQSSTFKSHKEDLRQPSSLGSEKQSDKLVFERSHGNHEHKRRKLRSSGSRSSLTSLIRTPEYSSSSDEYATRRRNMKLSQNSSKRSSVASSSHILQELKKDHELYDNITLSGNVAAKKHVRSKNSKTKLDGRDHQSAGFIYGEHNNEKPKTNSSKYKNTTIGSDQHNDCERKYTTSQSKDTQKFSASTAAQTDPVTEDTSTGSSRNEGEETSPRPAPPPRRKNKSSAATNDQRVSQSRNIHATANHNYSKSTFEQQVQRNLPSTAGQTKGRLMIASKAC